MPDRVPYDDFADIYDSWVASAPITRLNRAAVASLASEEVRARLSTFGMNIRSSTPEQAAAFVRAETVKWTNAIRQAGIEPE